MDGLDRQILGISFGNPEMPTDIQFTPTATVIIRRGIDRIEMPADGFFDAVERLKKAIQGDPGAR